MTIATRLFSYLSRNDAYVLTYHGVTSSEFRFPVWTQLETKQFEQHMRFLAKSDYNVCHLSQLVDHLVGGAKLPERTVAITFDDGFRNNATEAFPILERYGLPATIFLTADLIGTDELLWVDNLLLAILCTSRNSIEIPEIGELDVATPHAAHVAYRRIVDHLKQTPAVIKDSLLAGILDWLGPFDSEQMRTGREAFLLMSWDDARYMQQSGLVELAGHSCRHDILTRIEPDELGPELRRCRDVICKNTGESPDLFAYPNGSERDFNGEVIAAVEESGWKAAVTTIHGCLAQSPGRFQIRRLGVGRGSTTYDLEYMLSGLEAWHDQSFISRIGGVGSGLLRGTIQG